MNQVCFNTSTYYIQLQQFWFRLLSAKSYSLNIPNKIYITSRKDLKIKMRNEKRQLVKCGKKIRENKLKISGKRINKKLHLMRE